MQAEPVVIVRKKGGHGGHHGGAWKVAYADFVTAMMALFIVLWLMNSSKDVQEAISGYFNDPKGFAKLKGSGKAGAGEGVAVSKNDMRKLSEKLSQAMGNLPEFPKIKDNVQFVVTGEGLRVELLESEKGMFFDSGSPKPSASGEEILLMLAGELGRLPNDIVIEGHTDAKPFSAQGYSNWELSADRANSARRLMQERGLRKEQVVQVRGFAAQQLRKPEAPQDASNRRVSVIVRYPNAAEPAGEPARNALPPAH
ncbi:MAG: OmpA family protein [Acidobacteria bacterium]|nr:OmpA family protein [Acidobacteriota bacterium]